MKRPPSPIHHHHQPPFSQWNLTTMSRSGPSCWDWPALLRTPPPPTHTHTHSLKLDKILEQRLRRNQRCLFTWSQDSPTYIWNQKNRLSRTAVDCFSNFYTLLSSYTDKAIQTCCPLDRLISSPALLWGVGAGNVTNTGRWDQRLASTWPKGCFEV